MQGFSPEQYVPIEKVMKALANRRRLAILSYLKRKKKATVGDLARAIHLSFKATSKHLAILKGAELVQRYQQGLYMWYSLETKHYHSLMKPLISIL